MLNIADFENVKGTVCIVTTVDLSLHVLFPDFFPRLIARGLSVTGVCARTDGSDFVSKVVDQGVEVIEIPLSRDFSLLRDFRCLLLMRKLFAERKFDLIHYSTPKAALIASLASWSLNHPRRLYTLRGLGYQSYSGIKRRIGFICEKIAVKLAHRIVAISHSLREEVVESKLGPASKFEVLGAGSSKGVDCERFCRSQDIMLRGASLRSSLGIQEGDCVIGYAGRLSPEKGIPETVEAFLVNYASVRSVHLILVGDLDRRCPLDTTVMDRCASQLNIHCLPHTEDMPGCMAAFDVFVLPSHREGFGNVLIEASAMGIPVISSDITGCRDAVLDGQTGILVYPGDPIALAAAMDTLVGNSDLRRRLGEQGAAWVRRDFDRRVVWNNLIEVYDEMLKS